MKYIIKKRRKSYGVYRKIFIGSLLFERWNSEVTASARATQLNQSNEAFSLVKKLYDIFIKPIIKPFAILYNMITGY